MLSSNSVSAQIGFYGTLDSPPSFVTSYKEPFEGFSAAIYPQRHPYLSQKLRFKSRATASSFETNSIHFETEYYQRGREKYSLIPASVDAENFKNYRFKRLYLKNLADNFQSSMVNVDQRRGQAGLGVEIALPRRLEKIFGEGSAGLKVSGYKKVSFAGQSRWNDNAVSTTGVSQSKFPTLKMDQIDRFNITGTIGSKITVKVTQDSQTDIPLANRIQIRYKGDDDDILKSIEAGNTTLSLPNTRFVGYTSQIRGLFGLKAEAQVGNLRIIGIASQEKGSTEKTSVTANGSETPDFIRDYEYVERRIFDLGLPGELAPNDTVKTIYIYETAPSYSDDKSLPYANFYVNPKDTTAFSSENIIGDNISQVEQIESSQYTLVNDHQKGRHYVVFNNSRSRSYNIGCYMEVKRGDGTTDIYGNQKPDSTKNLFHLKLLSPSDDASSPTNQTWQLMWRNCYDVPKDALLKNLKIKVFKGLSGSEGTSSSEDFQEGNNNERINLLRILGLDQLSNCQKPDSKPDDVVDDCAEFYRAEWGLLIFPHRTPFDTDTTYTNVDGEMPPLDEATRVPNIYEFTSFTQKSETSEYYIQLTTTTRGSIIRLNQANIIENSEVITSNGDVLQRGVDYSIQYDFGQVTLTSDKATDPNANINIEYEYAPFFAVQKKSLLGLRAEYEWSKDLKFGTTFLYKSDKAQERKPKVGQETARTIIFDTDLSLKLYPSFLTNVVDALPLIETEAKSNLTISAEIAQSHPNPNVNDVAYVDDFESALDNLSLGVDRTTWKRGALPYPLDKNEYVQGKMLWHNTAERINVEDVYDRDTEVGGGTIRPFRMRFTPQNFKYDIEIDSANNVDTVAVTPSKSYGSIMRYFGSRVDDNRAQLFEVRLKVDTTGAYEPPVLHFDFGRINEDLNGNNLSDSEEKPNPPRDNEIYADEDIGLDTLPDNLEPGYNELTNPDPNGDNWYSFDETNPDAKGKCPLPPPNYCEGITSADPIFYDFLNGTEGNYYDIGGSSPDKETYSSNFNSADAYFSFKLDIRNYPDSFKVEGSERNGWVTYRIPIRDSAAVDDYVRSESNLNPEWNVISHIRVWMDADSTDSAPVSVEIADWYFVQMNWQDSVVYSPLSDRRTQFVVASIADDVDSLFEPPAGVEAYEDPQTNVVEVQKGLSLEFTDLNSYDTCFATKELLNVDQYSGYRRMEMFVHGDETINEANMEKVKFFFRIGRDNENFYEYHTDIYPGWDERNHVNFDFNEVTALKDSAQRLLEIGKDVDISNEKYRVFGNPNINEVRFFAAGVVNKDTANSIDGQIWLDELRVTEVRKDVGTAGRISVNGNMADFINYNFTLQSQDPYFRGLSSATRGGSSNNLGSGRQQTTLNTGMTINLQKLLPRSWEASLPVSLSYSKTVTTPLLRNNSDIILPEDVQKEEQIISESKSLTVSAKFNKKDGNPLFSVLLNRLKPRFSYRRNNQKTVVYPYSYGENIDIDANYNLSVKRMPTIPIFFWTKPIPFLKKTSESRFSFYPETWTIGGRFNRTITVNDDVNFKRTSSISRDFSGSVVVKYNMFSNFATTFNYDTQHDLTDLDDVNLDLKYFKLGIQTRYSQRFSATYDPKLLTFFTTSFSYKSSYVDDYVASNQSRRSTLSRNMSVNGTFEHQVLFGGKGTGSTERRFAGRRGVGRRKNVKEEEEKEKKKIYEPLLSGIRKITGWINPIKYGYSESYNNSLPGMLVRPGFRYRFGVEEDPNVPVTTAETRTQNSGKGNSFDLSSGFVLLGGLTTTVKYRKSETYDIVKANTRHRDITTNWPDLSIRIQKFRTFPLVKKYINKFIDIFAPRTGFSRQVKEQFDIDGNFPTNRSETKSFNPLMQVNFKLFRSLSLSSSVNKSETLKDNFAANDGAYLSSVQTTKNTFSFTGKYSFSSPHGLSIPLFGKLKFKSTVDLTLNVKYNESQTKNIYPDGQESLSTDKSDISYSPIIAYTFSQQIKGGLTLVWKDSKDKEKRSYAREVQIWTEIRF